GTLKGQEPPRCLAGDDRIPIEFAGWLPVYEFSGNCGQHPQFSHTADPPRGYRFTCSAPSRKRGTAFWHRSIARVLGELYRFVRMLGVVLRPLPGLFRRAPGVTLLVRLQLLAVLVRLFFTFVFKGASPFATLRFLQSRHFHSQLQVARTRS